MMKMPKNGYLFFRGSLSLKIKATCIFILLIKAATSATFVVMTTAQAAFMWVQNIKNVLF